MLFRRMVCINTHRLIFCQKVPLSTENFQTADSTDSTLDGASKESKLKTAIKKQKRRQGYNSDIRNFLQKKIPQYIDFIPKTLMRRACEKTNKLFIVDKTHAKTLASMISTELLSDSTHVMDCCPGLGLLTNELLKAGVPFIHLYETNRSFYKPGGPLSELMRHHPNKLKLYQLNFSKVWKLLLKSEFVETDDTDKYFIDVPYSQWEGESYMQVIDFSPSRNAITLIMYNFFKHTHLFERGRPCFYIGVPAPAWNNLLILYGRHYRQYNVMFNLFFDVKRLGELPREAFIPWSKSQHYGQDNSETPIIVVKFQPKKDVFEIITKDDLRSFWFFLKFCLRTRKNKVLAEFENLVPGSGVRFIQKDYDIVTTFKELSPQTLLELFKMYRSWPQYDEVRFNPSFSVEKSDEKLEDEFLEEFEQEPVDNNDQALSADDKRENG